MWGSRETWDPWAYVEREHPDVQVITMKLRDRVQGCIDRKRRIIWLDEGLTPVQARCTLAYEIAVLRHGPPPTDPCLASVHQRVAAEWAALMLVPTDVFASAWGESIDLDSMAASCGVDVPTFRARIRAASDADQDAAIELITRTRLSAA